MAGKHSAVATVDDAELVLEDLSAEDQALFANLGRDGSVHGTDEATEGAADPAEAEDDDPARGAAEDAGAADGTAAGAPEVKDGKKGNLGRALKESRGKAKELREDLDNASRLWLDAEADAQKARNAARATGAPRPALDPKVKLDRAKLLDPVRLDKFRQKANDENGPIKDFGAFAEHFMEDIVLPALEETGASAAKSAATSAVEHLNPVINEITLTQLEDRSRIRHRDFDAVLEKSGILQRISPEARRADPANDALARAIISDPNPAEKMYELARSKCAAEGIEIVVDEAPPALARKPVADATDRSAAAPAATLARGSATEERRAGAREVVDRITEDRPRGISRLPNAGDGKMKLTRGDIQRLAERNPDGYRALMQRRPEVRNFYLGLTDSL